MINVKNDDVDDSMVCDATDVYDNEALVTKFAEYQRIIN